MVYAKHRRCNPKFNCLSYINWRETMLLLFYQKDKKIKEDNISNDDLALKLASLTFFKRFSKNLIVILILI